MSPGGARRVSGRELAVGSNDQDAVRGPQPGGHLGLGIRWAVRLSQTSARLIAFKTLSEDFGGRIVIP